MREKNHPQPYRIYTQYILIGAAFGLYYGLFYRESTREPDYLIAALLSVVAAAVTVVVRSWKKGRTFQEILLDYGKVLFFFLVFMLGLELRKWVAGIGGKTAMVIFTTTIGTVLGFFAALRKKSHS